MNWTGFYTLIDRECYRFMRLFRQTVVPPIVTTVLFILIFGYSLGSRIKEIEGFSYIIFILPGLIQMGVVMNAYANTSTSLFMARMERSIENVLAAPLTNFQIVTSFMLGGLFRGVVVGATIMLCAMPFVSFPFAHPAMIVIGLASTSILFGGLGIISGLMAESWDHIATFTNFVITPFVYLGGVFYSIHMLPGFWPKISMFNPIFYCIDLLRYGFLGIADAPVALSLTVVCGLAILTYALCVFLFWKGYKLS
ncbi:MAG: ABC transporter permease [Deltaproteobacteria bacterium]|nr:ABC transporter permease [Deltaproteobacteria bacterium]